MDRRMKMGSKTNRLKPTTGNDQCRKQVEKWLSRDLKRLLILSFSDGDLDMECRFPPQTVTGKSGRKLFI